MICATLTDWELWPHLLPYCQVTELTGPRIAIRPIPVTERHLRRQALMVQVPCAKCGMLAHPIRERADGSWYIAVSCHTEDNYRCSRSRASHLEMVRIAEVVSGHERPFRVEVVPFL